MSFLRKRSNSSPPKNYFSPLETTEVTNDDVDQDNGMLGGESSLKDAKTIKTRPRSISKVVDKVVGKSTERDSYFKPGIRPLPLTLSRFELTHGIFGPHSGNTFFDGSQICFRMVVQGVTCDYATGLGHISIQLVLLNAKEKVILDRTFLSHPKLFTGENTIFGGLFVSLSSNELEYGQYFVRYKITDLQTRSNISDRVIVNFVDGLNEITFPRIRFFFDKACTVSGSLGGIVGMVNGVQVWAQGLSDTLAEMRLEVLEKKTKKIMTLNPLISHPTTRPYPKQKKLIYLFTNSFSLSHAGDFLLSITIVDTNGKKKNVEIPFTVLDPNFS